MHLKLFFLISLAFSIKALEITEIINNTDQKLLVATDDGTKTIERRSSIKCSYKINQKNKNITRATLLSDDDFKNTLRFTFICNYYYVASPKCIFPFLGLEMIDNKLNIIRPVGGPGRIISPINHLHLDSRESLFRDIETLKEINENGSYILKIQQLQSIFRYTPVSKSILKAFCVDMYLINNKSNVSEPTLDLNQSKN